MTEVLAIPVTGQASSTRCISCGHAPLQRVLDVPGVPVHVGVLWSSADEARRCATGDLALVACGACGLVTNEAFDEERIDYRQKYDNALHASAVFQRFESALVDHLIERYDLAGRTVVEIGCGNGHFLGLLCSRAGAQGIGYDPSHDPAFTDPLALDVDIRAREFGTDEHAVDLLVCRQTLEHIRDAPEFLRGLRALLKRNPQAVLYFDVPNSTMPFETLSIWDLIYEHVHYFVEASLRYLFSATGFEVLDLRESFEGQFLSLEARVGATAKDAPPLPQSSAAALMSSLRAFAQGFDERRDAWARRLAGYAARQMKVVVWGGGARAVSFFSMLDVGGNVPYVVDINPRKQGHYLAGSGQRIVAPDFLVTYQPDVVVALNPLYKSEIAQSLQRLGCEAEVVTA